MLSISGKFSPREWILIYLLLIFPFFFYFYNNVSEQIVRRNELENNIKKLEESKTGSIRRDSFILRNFKQSSLQINLLNDLAEKQFGLLLDDSNIEKGKNGEEEKVPINKVKHFDVIKCSNPKTKEKAANHDRLPKSDGTDYNELYNRIMFVIIPKNQETLGDIVLLHLYDSRQTWGFDKENFKILVDSSYNFTKNNFGDVGAYPKRDDFILHEYEGRMKRSFTEGKRLFESLQYFSNNMPTSIDYYFFVDEKVYINSKNLLQFIEDYEKSFGKDEVLIGGGSSYSPGFKKKIISPFHGLLMNQNGLKLFKDTILCENTLPHVDDYFYSCLSTFNIQCKFEHINK